ncbi:Reverse transcriptase [Theobroma cacao]|nr:Reverse transcriptase [Theobroma cacao]
MTSIGGKLMKTLFIKSNGKDILIVQIYVDDIVFWAINKSLCLEFAKFMEGEFEMSTMGELNYFLGLQIRQRQNDTYINQPKYTRDMFKKFGLNSSRSYETPISMTTKLDKDKQGVLKVYVQGNYFLKNSTLKYQPSNQILKCEDLILK